MSLDRYSRYSQATDLQLLGFVWQYEHHHQIADCTLRPHPSYCLDCHADVYNARETLRARGVNQWPENWSPSFS